MENNLQIINSLKILAVGVFAALYGFGGVRGKWKRRIIAPIAFTIGIAVFSLWTSSFSWFYLLCALLLYGSLSIGYGAVLTIDKIIKRSRYGLACAVASLPIFIVQEAWGLWSLHIAMCVGVSVVAGVLNEAPSARAEETLIGATVVLIPIFTV